MEGCQMFHQCRTASSTVRWKQKGFFWYRWTEAWCASMMQGRLCGKTQGGAVIPMSLFRWIRQNQESRLQVWDQGVECRGIGRGR